MLNNTNCNEKFSSNFTHAWLSLKMAQIQSLLFNRIFIQANTKATPFINFFIQAFESKYAKLLTLIIYEQQSVILSIFNITQMFKMLTIISIKFTIKQCVQLNLTQIQNSFDIIIQINQNHKQNPMKKRIKVKSLQGTPFLISLQEQIGKGSFGCVVRAYKKDQPSHELVAKIIPLLPQYKQSILAEIKILKQIPHHENLVNCIKMEICTEHNFYLIMEYCNGGSFEDYITQNYNCSQQLIWRFLRQFAKGYKVLYDCHLIHRDIKPQNILLHNNTFKIADFGFSRKVNHHNLTQNLSIKGTPLYIAPELQTESAGNSKIDIFSLGIVLYRLAYNGNHPFYNQKSVYTSVQQYFQHVLNTILKFPNYPKRSPELTELLAKMLQKNPVSRISWKQIFQHPKIKYQQVQSKFEQIEQFNGLRNSIIQINRSSASLKVISQPFNHSNQLGAQMQRLIQFTQYLPSFQIRGLEIYVTRSKVIIELIKHLNGNLKYLRQQKKSKLNHLIDQLIVEGLIFMQNSLQKLKNVIHKYETQILNHQTINKLLQNLNIQQQSIQRQLQSLNMTKKYEHLKYQNLLYDYLTQFAELKHALKQRIKIPTALMIDLYDGLLKLQSMIIINENGRIEIHEIQLQDAELDKIDYNNLSTYQKYLDSINQITLNQVQKGLKSMGLMIL